MTGTAAATERSLDRGSTGDQVTAEQPSKSSRMLRVEVNGLLHEWFDVAELGERVRSSSFAVTLRDNIAQYFGVEVSSQAVYDEDGLLATAADFSRALQRVSPKIFVYNVAEMSERLRERTSDELNSMETAVGVLRANFSMPQPKAAAERNVANGDASPSTAQHRLDETQQTLAPAASTPTKEAVSNSVAPSAPTFFHASAHSSPTTQASPTAQPSQPSQPTHPSQPSQPAQPWQPSQPSQTQPHSQPQLWQRRFQDASRPVTVTQRSAVVTPRGQTTTVQSIPVGAPVRVEIPDPRAPSPHHARPVVSSGSHTILAAGSVESMGVGTWVVNSASPRPGRSVTPSLASQRAVASPVPSGSASSLGTAAQGGQTVVTAVDPRSLASPARGMSAQAPPGAWTTRPVQMHPAAIHRSVSPASTRSSSAVSLGGGGPSIAAKPPGGSFSTLPTPHTRLWGPPAAGVASCVVPPVLPPRSTTPRRQPDGALPLGNPGAGTGASTPGLAGPPPGAGLAVPFQSFQPPQAGQTPPVVVHEPATPRRGRWAAATPSPSP